MISILPKNWKKWHDSGDDVLVNGNAKAYNNFAKTGRTVIIAESKPRSLETYTDAGNTAAGQWIKNLLLEASACMSLFFCRLIRTWRNLFNE